MGGHYDWSGRYCAGIFAHRRIGLWRCRSRLPTAHRIHSIRHPDVLRRTILQTPDHVCAGCRHGFHLGFQSHWPAIWLVWRMGIVTGKRAGGSGRNPDHGQRDGHSFQSGRHPLVVPLWNRLSVHPFHHVYHGTRCGRIFTHDHDPDNHSIRRTHRTGSDSVHAGHARRLGEYRRTLFAGMA